MYHKYIFNIDVNFSVKCIRVLLYAYILQSYFFSISFKL